MLDKFENYIKIGKAKKKTPDKVEAISLIEKAEKRMKYIRLLNEDTSSLVFEDAYESAREAAQSLMSIKGYKPYSHEATISFLKDFFTKKFTEQELREFDRYREIRNNSIYKAVNISTEDAKKCIEFSKLIIKKIKEVINETK